MDKGNDYNHDAESVELAVGVNIVETEKKIKVMLDSINEKGGCGSSHLVEKIENLLTHRELALMFFCSSMAGTVRGGLKQGAKVIPMGKGGQA